MQTPSPHSALDRQVAVHSPPGRDVRQEYRPSHSLLLVHAPPRRPYAGVGKDEPPPEFPPLEPGRQWPLAVQERPSSHTEPAPGVHAWTQTPPPIELRAHTTPKAPAAAPQSAVVEQERVQIFAELVLLPVQVNSVLPNSQSACDVHENPDWFTAPGRHT